ncbi:STAS domain-containing protein [Amycolatopsis antarctica]|uniref:STAS domain-containing protein n=1 Tax=Amycolatopsis antarctica TaxID=1854586 RepID=UPI0013FD75A1|nr:STAS domain-containing protein [Amycolatopsis antarctica]
MGTHDLHIATSETENAVIVEVRGGVDDMTEPQFRRQLLTAESLPPTSRAMVLDLRQVDFLGSVGLTALVRARLRAERAQRELMIVAAHRCVVTPMRITGIDKRIGLYGTLALALEELATTRLTALRGC